MCLAFTSFIADEAQGFKELVTATLGGSVIEGLHDMHKCTHLVVNTFDLLRTVNLCIGISLPSLCIVTEEWIEACESAKAFVPTAPYLLSGVRASRPEAPYPWRFDATESRKRALEGTPCLYGHTFYVTASKKPKPSELKLIIEAAGGVVLGWGMPATASSASAASSSSAASASSPPPIVVVSTEKEKAAWAASLKATHEDGVVVVLLAEKLLSCVLQQSLDLGEHNLLA